jgi:hypothetical protein
MTNNYGAHWESTVNADFTITLKIGDFAPAVVSSGQLSCE